MYIEKNLNPEGKKTDDCAIRAVAAACSLSWDDAFDQLVKAAKLLHTVPNHIDAVEVVLVAHGFSVGKIKHGEKKPTVADFSRNNPDIVAVLRVSHHLTACAKGNYVDIWDCGSKHIYKYWYKRIA